MRSERIIVTVSNGVVGGGQQGGNCPSPQILGCQKIVKIFLLSEDFCQKLQNLGLKTPGTSRGKIKIVSTYNFLCRLQLSVGKLQTSCPAYFFLTLFNPQCC